MSTPPQIRSDHDIPLRKPDLEFDASIPRHWLNGNVFATQFFNGLNLVFPDHLALARQRLAEVLPTFA